jgi:hypothetical protein
VGAQLSWSLRPFIESKEQPFEILRKKEGNFYQAVIVSFIDLLGGGGKSSEIGPKQENFENSELIGK